MKGRKLVLLTLMVCCLGGRNVSAHDAQESTGWQWMHRGLTFRPAVASVHEPRMGFTFFGESSDIRLDIGTAVDVLYREYRGGTLAVGGEFLTYTLLWSWENAYFPVIAVDYFFGFNVSYSRAVESRLYSARFRFTHISAHFVDGHYDKETQGWRDGTEPIIYSREFIELIGSYQLSSRLIHRIYFGSQFILNVTPGWLGQFAFQGGYELFLPTRRPSVTPYAAYDIRLVEIGDWGFNHSVQTGVKFGNRFGRGIDLFVCYYSGFNVHGMLFDERLSYWGTGFNIHM